jgi:hypothetical protein
MTLMRAMKVADCHGFFILGDSGGGAWWGLRVDVAENRFRKEPKTDCSKPKQRALIPYFDQ